jgi:hypothetical protein
MDKINQISRTKFLQQMAVLGAASIVAPFASRAGQGSQKKIRIGVIGCGSVSTQY